MAEPGPSGDGNSSLPRGLLGRKGTPAGKSARLPSIRAPRDLTLGGIKKKTFAPNIPTKREKLENVEAADAPSKSHEKKGRGSNRGRERGRGRGRGRGQPEVIQSHSIFEKGPAGEKLNRQGSGFSAGYGERSSGGGSGGGASSKIKREKPTSEETKRMMQNIMRDDFIDVSGKQGDGSFFPVQLPHKKPVKKSTVKKDVKMETDEASEAFVPSAVKKEDDTKVQPKDLDLEAALGQDEVEGACDTDVPSSGPLTCSKLFTDVSKSDELLLIQLPDMLPGDPAEKDPIPRTKDKPTNSSDVDSLAKKLEGQSLEEFGEGYVGKLQIRKSGKTQLMLGNIALDIGVGTPVDCLRELVSVQLNEDPAEPGDMYVLGHFNHKLVCVPDFEYLLNQVQH